MNVERTRRQATSEPRTSVLVAEDDEELATVIAETLDAIGYDVRVAMDGEVALEILHREDPAVLVVDLGLPKHDGLVVAQIARRGRGEKLPIIAITGWGQPDVHARARAAGCDVVLMKPFTIDELQDTIARLCARTRPS